MTKKKELREYLLQLDEQSKEHIKMQFRAKSYIIKLHLYYESTSQGLRAQTGICLTKSSPKVWFHLIDAAEECKEMYRTYLKDL